MTCAVTATTPPVQKIQAPELLHSSAAFAEPEDWHPSGHETTSAVATAANRTNTHAASSWRTAGLWIKSHHRRRATAFALFVRYQDRWLGTMGAMGTLECRRGVRLPVVPAECDQAFQLFHLIFPSPDDRRAIRRRAGIRSPSAGIPALQVGRENRHEPCGRCANARRRKD